MTTIKATTCVEVKLYNREKKELLTLNRSIYIYMCESKGSRRMHQKKGFFF